jgi:predicted nucleic acid-binding protein
LRLFLDTSVVLSACGSEKGASRKIFDVARDNDWTLIATPYVLREVIKNLDKLPEEASAVWAGLQTGLFVVDDVVTLDRPVIFGARKDRPILFSALAWADVLLTLDRGDFGQFLGGAFYDLPVLKPGDFLRRERDAGRL